MTLPEPKGPLENHQFDHNPLRQSKVELLTGYGWIELETFPATVDGLARACRRYRRARDRPPVVRREGVPQAIMGIALWVGPALAACELSQSIRRAFYGERAPAPAAPPITVEGREA